MSATNKTEALRKARENAPQTREDAPGTKQEGPDYSNYKAPSTVTISARIEPRDRDRLEKYSAEHGLKLAQVVRSWILERMRREGL